MSTPSRKINLVVLLLLISGAGCGVQTPSPAEQQACNGCSSSNGKMDASAEAKVRLLWSTHTTSSSPIPYTLNHILQGVVEVADLAYDKEVVIHFVSDDGQWHDASASYTGPSDRPGYELWSFNIQQEVYKNPPESFFRFAIRYRVAGSDYWDNNNGQDYQGNFTRDQQVETPKEVESPVNAMVHLLRAEYSTTDHPSPYTLTHNLYGEIEVKNSGQDKKVTVHYSLGGDEWYTLNAEFDRMSETSGYEIWTFRLSEPVYKVPPQDFFRFALQYRVSGEEYWDNNNGQDYFGTSF